MAEEATAAMANVALAEDDAGAEDFSAGRVGVALPGRSLVTVVIPN